MSLLGKPTLLAFLALLILSIPALINLGITGLYTSHDGETHTARMAQYFEALKDGQIPPRFANSFYNGLGSPIFVYIYPLPYFIGAVFHLSGANFPDSFKIIMALSFIFSAFFTYLWLKEFFQNPKAAFGGAVFYVFVPYRFLLIYVRGSISEILAYTFLPLCLFLFTKLIKTQKLSFVPLAALSVGFLLLSQNLVALLSLPIIFIYILILALYNKPIKSLLMATAAIVWGGAISAITYLPAGTERNFVHFDSSINNAYLGHFVTINQLFHSPWGYGFDLPGTVNDQMSFQLGLAQILIVGVAVGLLFAGIVKTKLIKRYINRLNSMETIAVIFFLIVFLIAVVLMLDIPFTLNIWNKYRALTIIDIPWRLLGITSLAAAFLAASVFKSLKPGLFFVLLILLVLIANRNHMRINQARFLSDDFFLKYLGTATQYNEFTPKWRQTGKVPLFFDPNIKYQMIAGSGNIEVIKSNSKVVHLTADIKTPSAKILINRFYFPGAIIKLNNKNLEVFKDYQVSNAGNNELNSQQDQSGLPEIILPQGHSEISFQYGETFLRSLANVISFSFTLLALISILLLSKNYSPLRIKK